MTLGHPEWDSGRVEGRCREFCVHREIWDADRRVFHYAQLMTYY